MYRKSPRPNLTLLVVAIGQFVVSLDISVVNVALPAIRHALGFDPADLPWVVNVYALFLGGFLLLGGRAADLYGRRRLFTGGLLLFGLASLAGGIAHTAWQLVAARAAQGLAAAAMTPAALAMLTTTFTEPRARTRALGVWSAVAGVGGASGVLAGGLLTEYAGWRWVMLINVPIVVIGLVLAMTGVAADTPDPRRGRLDLPGALLGTTGVGLAVLGVVQTDRHSWTSATTLGTLAVAVALLVAFLLVEAKTAGSPLIRLDLLARRPVAGANLFVLLLFAGQFAAFYFVSLYLQQVLRMSAAATGAAFLPFSFGIVAGSFLATRARRSPHAGLVLGAALSAVGFGWFGLISPDGTFLADVLGPSLVTSIGIGLCLTLVAGVATADVPPHEAGMASGLINTARQIGGCVGLATLTTIAAQRTGTATSPAALTDGYALGLTISGVLLAGAVVVALTMLRTRTASHTDETPNEPVSLGSR